MKQLVKLLKPAKEKGKFYCPACDGHNFSVNLTTGAYQCFNGCSTAQIREAVKPLLPEPPQTDRTEKAPRERKTTEYFYPDRDGNPSVKVVKVVPGRNGKGKSIYQQHWNGTEWEDGRGPVKTPDIPLYRYADVMAAIAQGEAIVLCEGESTTDAFWDKGIPATTTIGGTGGVVTKAFETVDGQKLTRFKRNLNGFESIKPALADLGEAEVILAPDRDKPGCLHMEMMAEILNVKGWLYALPQSPQFWQALEDKGGIDFVDWIHDYPKLTKQEILNYVVPNPTHASPASPQPQLLEFSAPTPKKRPKASALARQLHRKHPHLVYVADRKVWMRYEAMAKGVWTEIPAEAVERLAMQLIEELGCDDLDSTAYITQVVDFLWLSTSAYADTWDEADNQRYLPFTNGVLDLETNQLKEHNPKYHLTWTLPRPHDATARDWEAIDKWLDFASQEKQNIRNILICFASAVLKGRADLQKFLHLVGIGGSGKGTFMRLITSLIGANNVVTSNLEQFCTNRFETARVHGKRLVLFSDERSKPRNISEFMKLTGQDMLRAEKKQKEAFDFTFDGMVILASEFPLFYGEMGNGLKRRTIPLSMNARVEDKDRRDLQADFESELPAFTNFLLELPDEFISENLRNVAETQEVKLQYWQARMAEDSISDWLNERLIPDSTGAVIPLKKLYEDYKDYCQESGNQTKSNKRFAVELLEVCQSIQWQIKKITSKNGRMILGLKIRQGESYKDLPTYENQLEQKNQVKGDGLVTDWVTDWVTLESSPCIAVTDVTDFSNKIAGEKNLEKLGCQNQGNPVSQDTSTPRRESSTFTDVVNELNDSWLASHTKPSSVKEADFIAKFSNLKAVEIHLQKLEKAKRIVRSRGRIYNAVKSMPAVGDVIVFKTQEGEEKSGEVKRIDYPHFHVDVYGKMAYVHIEVIQKR